MSDFIVCDGTVTATTEGLPSCDGTWSTVSSSEVAQTSLLTPEEWSYVGDQLVWLLLTAGIAIALLRAVQNMTPRGDSNET